ncbi:protein FAM166B-like isoform X2 [Zootermopsis nevadensis]|uniref:protein FAM166B-like isoform X2 n=1 Tax=Zootermopsis nevadensis TaxID=136037 RepID=UPI000B8E667C|nr:protein FAM166B-like isoform X2 [Zootermopsis nevadensis]
MRSVDSMYTGHCPTLKFRFGKPYGANTKDIIKELSVKDLSVRHEPYRQSDPNKVVLTTAVRKEGHAEDPVLPFKHRARRYVLGYTGYIPGMNFRYGKSFQRAADDSVMEFSQRMSQEKVRKEKDRGHRSQSAPKMPPVRSRDEVKNTLNNYHSCKYSDNHISPEFPPIAGYTGHIPRVRSTEVSLSQRYNTAARNGLALLREERQRRSEIEEATQAVRRALQHDSRYTIPAM